MPAYSPSYDRLLVTLVLIGCALMHNVVLADELHLYFSPTSTKAPIVGLPCPSNDPCFLGNPSGPHTSTFLATNVTLHLLDVGSQPYRIQHETTFTSTLGSITLSTESAAILDLQAPFNLGSSTSSQVPFSSSIVDANLALIGPIPLNMVAATQVAFQRSSIDMRSGSSPVFANIRAALLVENALSSFVSVASEELVYHGRSDASVFNISGASAITTVDSRQSQFHGYADLYILDTTSLLAWNIVDTTAAGSGTGALLTSSSSSPPPPIQVRFADISFSEVSGCDPSTPCLNVVELWFLTITRSRMSGTYIASASNNAGWVGIWGSYIDRASLLLNNFASVAYVMCRIAHSEMFLSLSSSFVGWHLSMAHSNITIHPSNDISSQYIWLGAWYSLNSTLDVQGDHVTLGSGVYERPALSGPAATVVARHLDTFQMTFVQSGNPPISSGMNVPPVLRASPLSSSSPLSILSVATIVDSLEFFSPTSDPAQVDVFGMLAVRYALRGPVRLSPAGWLTFASAAGLPVSIGSSVRILPGTNASVIAAAVSSSAPGSGAAHFEAGSFFDPSNHFLEVVILRSDLSRPIDGTEPVPLFFGVNDRLQQPWRLVFNTDLNFEGSNFSNSSGVYYSVKSFRCPNNCSSRGTCVGVNTCACNAPFSGYSCGCTHDGVMSPTCSPIEDNHWLINSDINVDSTQLRFPKDTSANVFGSITNSGSGSLIIDNAMLDISGGLRNDGNFMMFGKVERYSDMAEPCGFRSTVRADMRTLDLVSSSQITVNLDLSGADVATCPSPWDLPIVPTGTASRREPLLDPFHYSQIARAVALSPTIVGDYFKRSSSDLEGGATSMASRRNATIDADTSTLGGKLVINLSGTSSKEMNLRILNTRNETKTTSLSTGTPLDVKVNTPPGVCAAVDAQPSYVNIFVTPCSTDPKGSNTSPTAKWIRYGIPLIVGGTLVLVAVVIIVLSLTVPSVRYFFRPFAKRADQLG